MNRPNHNKLSAFFMMALMILSAIIAPLENNLWDNNDDIEGINALTKDAAKSTSHSTTNSVMISEVLLDPLGDTSGASVIVIRNYGTESADISGWKILAESYEVVHQFSEPTTLGAFTSMYIHLEQAGIVPESASIQQVYVMPSNLIFLTEQLDSVSSESLGLGDYAISTGSFSLWTSNDDIVDYLRWEESSGGSS